MNANILSCLHSNTLSNVTRTWTFCLVSVRMRYQTLHEHEHSVSPPFEHVPKRSTNTNCLKSIRTHLRIQHECDTVCFLPFKHVSNVMRIYMITSLRYAVCMWLLLVYASLIINIIAFMKIYFQACKPRLWLIRMYVRSKYLWAWLLDRFGWLIVQVISSQVT